MAARLTRRKLLTTGAAVATSSVTACRTAKKTPSGPPTLVWWDYFNSLGQIAAVNKLIARFKAENPGVQIDRRSIPFADLQRSILQGAGAGLLPDLAIVDNVSNQALAATGILADLTDLVEAWGQKANYFPGPWSSTQYKRRTYGIPNNSNCIVLYYNAPMLRQAGIAPPTTWEELRAAAKALTRGDTRGLALSAIKTEEGTFHFLPFLWQAGGDLDSLGGEAGVAALELIANLVKDGSVSRSILGWTQADIESQFESGNVAMQINGPWQIPSLHKNAASLDWQVAPLPVRKKPATCLGGENWVIFRTSPHVDAAWKLLEFSQREEILVDFLRDAGQLPQRRDIVAVGPWMKDPVLKVFVESLPYAGARAYGPRYPQMSEAIGRGLQMVLSGKNSAQEAASAMARIVTPLLRG
jgi:multiple sugar transport system substrate-binding protein